MTDNTDELAGLSEDVREAVRIMDAGNTVNGAWNACRDELVRLARENAELRSVAEEAELNREGIKHAHRELREVKAELAALKRKIAEAPVFLCEADIISGSDYDYISAVLRHDDPAYQYPNLDGQRVALLPIGGE